MYNKIIKLIIIHKLENCLENQEKLIVLSEVLTQLIYNNLPSLLQIDKMLYLLNKYRKKIYQGCRVYKLSPATNFEPPQTQKLLANQRQDNLI